MQVIGCISDKSTEKPTREGRQPKVNNSREPGSERGLRISVARVPDCKAGMAEDGVRTQGRQETWSELEQA